jgi:type IV pilus assembly protein PilQ
MKMQNNKLILGLLVIFLSSCVPSGQLNKGALLELNKGSNGTSGHSLSAHKLIDSETFIVDTSEQVKASALTGPIVDSDSLKFKSVKTSSRRQINKEEQENNNNVSSEVDKSVAFPISINFENISIKDMLQMFSEATGKNILIGDEVNGLVSAKLNNVPWDKALDSILKIKKLAKYVDDEANIIRIHSQEVLVAQVAYDLQIIEATKKTNMAQSSIEPLYTEVFKLFYTTASDVSTDIKSVLNGASTSEDTQASLGVEITIDERLNYLIVKATKEQLDFIEILIGELDVRTKQVLIEAFIVESSEEFGEALGAKFGITGPNANILGLRDGSTDTVGVTGLFENDGDGTVVGNALGLILGTTTKNLAIDLKASETKGITKILSNPRVFTLDGKEAQIKQVDQIPYTKIEEGEKVVELKDAGITLKVTPVIVGDGNIILTVEIEKSTVDITIADPPIASNTITTQLLVKDQTIVVIGGLYIEDFVGAESKTPILGDLPLIGFLFKKETKKDKRKEILVFLAPTII